MTSGDQWISYEDVDSAALKVNFYKLINDYVYIYLGTICKSRTTWWSIYMEY
jgi:hypothetical protein